MKNGLFEKVEEIEDKIGTNLDRRAISRLPVHQAFIIEHFFIAKLFFSEQHSSLVSNNFYIIALS